MYTLVGWFTADVCLDVLLDSGLGIACIRDICCLGLHFGTFGDTTQLHLSGGNMTLNWSVAFRCPLKGLGTEMLWWILAGCARICTLLAAVQCVLLGQLCNWLHERVTLVYFLKLVTMFVRAWHLALALVSFVVLMPILLPWRIRAEWFSCCGMLFGTDIAKCGGFHIRFACLRAEAGWQRCLPSLWCFC